MVWNSTLTDPTQVAVLAYLANCADDAGGNCFPGLPRLAKIARRSERTVTRTLQELEQGGWIAIERGCGRGNLTHFQIDIEKLKGCQDVTLSPRSKRVTPTQERVTLATRKGDIGDNPPHPLYGRTTKEPPRNQTPPNPLVNEGGGGLQKPNLAHSALETPGVDAAVEQVMQGCGFTARRLGPVLREVIRQQADRGEPPPTTALAMIAAWKSYILQGSKLRVRWGARRFFAEGYWNKPDGWPWDGAALREERMQAEAQIGSYAPQ
jgi:hypothetical protein